METTAKADGIINEFKNLMDNRHTRLKEWKQKTGKSIVGYLCSWTPVELINAAGVLPVRMLGSWEGIQEAGAYLPHFTCHPLRSAYDLALRKVSDYIDGLVAPRTCDSVRAAFDSWIANSPLAYNFFLQTPTLLEGEGVEDFYIKETMLLKDSLESYINRKITDDDLRGSIRLYNENRRLIREVYQMRKVKSDCLSGTEMTSILLTSLLMPIQEHSQLIRELLTVLPERKGLENSRARVMVISAMLDYANFNILKEIERVGANIVIDHSCVGTRNVLDDVVENGDPLRSIVKRYLDRIPCPTKYPTKPWFDNIMELAKDYRVDGVIFLIEKFCDAHAWTYPHLRDLIEKNNVKTLRIELGEAIAPMGQIRTRVGAFCEMLAGKKA